MTVNFKKNFINEITFRDAIKLSIHDILKKNKKFFVMGIDVGLYGGAYGVTKGLINIFGDKRVIDTPISEAAIVGSAIGAAMTGLRPIVEIMYIDFFPMAMDQIVNQAAKIRYMFGGQVGVPMIIRTQGGTGRSAGAQHSQSLESWIMHIPGLYLFAPSNPNDAYHLLKLASTLKDPTIFLEHKLLYNTKGSLNKKESYLNKDRAHLLTKGSDLTIISYSRMIKLVMEANLILKKLNIDSEIIDLRSLKPLDSKTIIKSVKKTKKALIISESHYTASVASEISSIIFEHCYKFLSRPVVRYTAEDVPFPSSPNLEKVSIPTIKGILKIVKELVKS